MSHFVVPAGFLEVTGDDRADFVNAQVTGDVRRMPEGSTLRTLLLNHRGHALAQMTVAKLPDRLVVAVEEGQEEYILTEFRDRVIFDQVEIMEVPDGRWTLIHMADQELPDNAMATAAADRIGSPGTDGLYAGAGPELGDPLGPEEILARRVAALVPAAVADAGEGVLPQEAGLEPLISYRKGCYLGQEIMARIEARGNLRRQLTRLRLSGPPEADDRDIFLDGRRVGRLGSVSGAEGDWTALAVLRSDLAPDASLSVAGVSARVL